MNKRERAIKRNDTARLIRYSNKSGSHRNCIRINIGSTFAHEVMKFHIAWDLIAEGHEVMIEAIFENEARADVLDLDTATVYEILHSETAVKAMEKINVYPPELEIIGVDSLTGEKKLLRRRIL